VTANQALGESMASLNLERDRIAERRTVIAPRDNGKISVPWVLGEPQVGGLEERSQDGCQHLVDLLHIVKRYDTAAGSFTALRGIDLTVEAGEFRSIIGKSGSGKSTLINIITGIDRPTAGQVWVDRTAVHALTEQETAIWRGRTIGVIFQFFQLLPTLTAVENILLAMDYGGIIPPGERPGRAMHLLEQVGMADHAHDLPSALPGGQQQSVAIARALANDPPLVTADEPTGNLDSRSAQTVLRLFERLVGEGKTILMVTHDLELAARAERTLVLADGEIVDDWTNRPSSLHKWDQEIG
jgi:putative ABC transport system ATP-binding protein